jgi:hypothetical protein
MKPMMFILCILFTVSVFSDTNEALQELMDEGIIEGIDKSFRTIPGSNVFVETFSLNDQEVDLIGIWVFDGVINESPRNRQYGPGISISLYPNRLFSIQRERADLGQIRKIVGMWRVKNNVLQVRFIAKLVVINTHWNTDISELFQVQYMDSHIFYSIFNVPQYETVYCNKNAFNWDEIPETILSFYEFSRKDAPRSRLLFDTLGNPPGDLTKEGKQGAILLNPVITDEYLIRLAYVW